MRKEEGGAKPRNEFCMVRPPGGLLLYCSSWTWLIVGRRVLYICLGRAAEYSA